MNLLGLTMPEKTIIALDLGSTTGFAIKDKYGITYGTLSFKVGGKWHDSGFNKLTDWLFGFVENLCGPNDIELVVECPHAGKFLAANRVLFGLLGSVHAFATKYGIPLIECKPTQIKKSWTGKGNADKQAMVKKTQEVYPNIKDHNESDAIAILSWYLETK